MRKIDLIVIHCSATREDRPFTEHDLDTAHRLRGFDGIGYHFYVSHGLAKDTRTEWQRHSLRVLVRALKMDYPEARVVGHRDLSPDVNGNGEVEPMEWTKECPCFEVEKERW